MAVHCFYHGTNLKNIASIHANGLEIGEGMFGYDGVFFSKSPEGALYWAKYGWKRGSKDYRETQARKDGYIPVILRACLPSTYSENLIPDFNQAEDVVIKTKDGKFYSPYDPDLNLPWHDERVEDIIWQSDDHGDSEDPQPCIPSTFIDVCTNLECNQRMSLDQVKVKKKKLIMDYK